MTRGSVLAVPVAGVLAMVASPGAPGGWAAPDPGPATSGPVGSDARSSGAKPSSDSFQGDPLEEAGYDVERRMNALDVPGMSLAVFEGDALVWSEGYGVRAEGRRQVTPTTLFQAASMSKPVAALGILRMAEDGHLDLDEDVNRFLDSWTVPENALTREEPVTLRRILTHRAGLTVHGFPGYPPGDSLPELPEILNGEAPANTDPVRVDVRPGSLERYSGGGTTVAEMLVEDVASRPFPEVMRELVLEPLGMGASTYRQPLPQARHSDAAWAHAGGSPVSGGWHIYPERAAAGLWTTAEDLAQVAMEVHRSLEGRDDALLRPASAEAMVTAEDDGSFAVGFMVQGSGKDAVFQHGGVNRGFEGILWAQRYPARGAVVLTNAEGGTLLAEEVLAAVAEGRGWGGGR